MSWNIRNFSGKKAAQEMDRDVFEDILEDPQVEHWLASIVAHCDVDLLGIMK